MPQPHQLPELARLAEEFLTALREATQAAAGGDHGRGSQEVTNVSDLAARFSSAAAASPDLARAVAASPGLAALSLVSRPLSELAAKHPDLAELAVVSPNLALVASRSPEMAALAKASPPLAAAVESMLSRLSGNTPPTK